VGHIVIRGLPRATIFFCTLSHKRKDFRKKKILDIKCVFWFSVQRLSEIFLILRKIQRDTIIYVHRSSCKVPVIPVKTLIELAFSRQIINYWIPRKSVEWKPRCSMRTDGHDELPVAFRDFDNRPIKICNVWISPNVKQYSLRGMHAPYAMRLGFTSWFNYSP